MAYGLNDPLPFGKYKGLSIGAIAKFDPAYLLWIKRNLERFQWSPDALSLAKNAWTRDYFQRLERQNGWAWGFGRDVRACANRARSRAIGIELDERRKAGLLPTPEAAGDA
ncbi:exodeoxyribonuclease X C-terminal domain-containing protein [Sphingomonas koreensis]